MGQKLRHHAPLHLTCDLTSLGSDGVDLVDEDDGRCCLLGIIKDLSEPLLALAVILGHDLRPGYGEEIGAALVGHRLGDEGLAPCPGGP